MRDISDSYVRDGKGDAGSGEKWKAQSAVADIWRVCVQSTAMPISPRTMSSASAARIFFSRAVTGSGMREAGYFFGEVFNVTPPCGGAKRSINA